MPEFIAHAKGSRMKEVYGIDRLHTINVTGGGGFKYAALLKQEMDIVVRPQDEMRSLVLGVNFLLLCCEAPLCFTYAGGAKVYRPIDEATVFPYLLVNVGSGVSVLKVTAPETYERVSGSLIGGGTFWGLCCLLTSFRSFDEILRACETGDHSRVDLYVKDIYGKNYDSIGLGEEMMASSFGKVQRVTGGRARERYAEADVAQGLMTMVCGSVAHLGYELSRTYGIGTVYFAGGFVARNAVVWSTITDMITNWSGGTVTARFLEYDGYFGALGALLLSEYGDVE